MSDLEPVRRGLACVVERAGAQLSRARLRAAARAGLRPAAWALVLVPAAVIVLQLASLALGRELELPGALALSFGALCAALLVLALRLLEAQRVWPPARAVLMAVDRRLGLDDRLSSAHEFLDRRGAGSFELAAVADAGVHLDAALAVELEGGGSVFPPGRREQALCVLALALVVLSALLPGGIPGVADEQTESLATALGEGALAGPAREATLVDPPQAPPEQEQEPEQERAGLAAAPSPRREASQLGERVKESAGRAGAGRSSGAESASSAGPSRGAPSNQSQTSKGEARQAPKPTEAPRERPPADSQSEREATREEDSGATAGVGTAKGSNRNPTASEWTSKDQAGVPDEEEVEDDVDVEDEDEEQENRGGMQPNLRDRKPPVSRDLRIGFGGNPNLDANGRGGPSEQKKSRGTASMVLGVPIPDRVKGQPNPGRTRITQERVEPRAEQVGGARAGARTPRATPGGQVSRPSLSPWMRELVTQYFESLRAGEIDP